MNKGPILNYQRVVKALQRDGWVLVRQKGSHIRLQKHLPDETLKIIIPATIQLNAQRWRTFSNKQNYQLRNSTSFFELQQITGKQNDQDISGQGMQTK